MNDPAPRANPFFSLVIVAGGLFVVTILAAVATMFGEETSPLNQSLDRHLGVVLAVEVAATLLFGLLAMTIDGRETRRRESGADSADLPDSHDDAANGRDDAQTDA